MKNLNRKMLEVILFKRSPSPRPSPPGRGRAVGRILRFLRLRLQSPLHFRLRSKRHNYFEHPRTLWPVNVSPSPGGEGRGEGGRQCNFIPFSTLLPLRLLTSAATRSAS